MPDIAQLVKRMLEPLASRVNLAISRGVVKLVDDAPRMQELQVTLLKGEVLDKVEHFQPLGLSSVPLTDAEVVVACVGGLREHPLAIVVDDRNYRPTGGAPGEVTIYHPTAGQRIVLKASGDVEITTSGGKVTIAGDLEVSGDVTATGDVEDSGGTLQGFRNIYNIHTHKETGAGGGTTLPTTSTA